MPVLRHSHLDDLNNVNANDSRDKLPNARNFFAKQMKRPRSIDLLKASDRSSNVQLPVVESVANRTLLHVRLQ